MRLDKLPFTLRSHQQMVHDLTMSDLHRFKDYLGVWAVPASGKSILPLIAYDNIRRAGLANKLVVVVPRDNLAAQMEHEFSKQIWKDAMHYPVKIRRAKNDSDPGRGCDGYIVTYAALCRDDDGVHRDYFSRNKVFIVPDEFHHVCLLRKKLSHSVRSGRKNNSHRSDKQKYYAAIEPLLRLAKFRMPLSGYPKRDDGNRIAMLQYTADECGSFWPRMDVEYGYRQAILEEAIIRSEFYHVDGVATYVDRNGIRVDGAGFSSIAADPLLFPEDTDRVITNRDSLFAALRTDYARELLAKCVKHWREWRQLHPRSRVLCVCSDIKHAQEVCKWLVEMGVRAVVATSEDGRGSERIERMRLHNEPEALVTVAMAYEGMDIPSITHLCVLTHIRSVPWLLQMFGRNSRFDKDAGPWAGQMAFNFVPDDPEMTKAISIIRSGFLGGVKEKEEREAIEREGGARSAIATFVVPLGSESASFRVSVDYVANPDSQCNVRHFDEQAIRKVEALKRKYGIPGAVSNVASLLEEAGVDLGGKKPPLADEMVFDDEPKREPRVITPSEEEERIRVAIQSLANRIDEVCGLDYGSTNRKLFMGVQGKRPRKDLHLEDLKKVLRCVERMARSVNVEGDGK